MFYNHMKNSDVCVLLIDDYGGSKIGEAVKYLTAEMKTYLTEYAL